MDNPLRPIPADYRGVIAALAFERSSAAIEFYVQVFGAVEVMRLAEPTGKVGHAELLLAGGKLMLADEWPPYNATPRTVGGNSVVLHLHVDNVDAVVERAAAAGAKVLMPPVNQFYGDRAARVCDPFGYVWSLATRVEDVSPEECLRRWDAWLAGAAKGANPATEDNARPSVQAHAPPTEGSRSAKPSRTSPKKPSKAPSGSLSAQVRKARGGAQQAPKTKNAAPSGKASGRRRRSQRGRR